MIDYSKWKEKRMNVSSLYLDHLNPRITTRDKGFTQNELINQLIKRYKVYELAKSIANDGYFPEKNLIVFFEKNKYVVIEGNRRLAAVKTLINPDIVEEKERKKFKNLNQKIDMNYIKQIRVTIAPSREAANPIVFREHTLPNTMSWSKVMQSEFYVRQVNNGMSISDIEEEYNITSSKVRDFLKLYNMYQIACCIDIDEDVREKVEDKQSFPATTLERAYTFNSMKNFLGISFSENGDVNGNVSKNEFEAVYSKIITDIVNKKIDSRRLGTEKQTNDYIKKSLNDFKPKEKGKFTQKDFIPPEVEIKEPITTPPKKRSVRKSPGVIPSGIPFKLEGSANLQKFYDELRKVSAKSYPNASAVVLRAFLDKSIRMYLKKHQIKKIKIKIEGKDKNKKIDDATLGELLEFLTARDVKIINDNNVKKVIKHWKNSSGDISLSTLNSLVHNEEYATNEKQIREIWTKLEGLFKIILLEPERV